MNDYNDDFYDIEDDDDINNIGKTSGKTKLVSADTKEALLFVIDATENMFKPQDEEGRSCIQVAIQSVIDSMMNRIILRDSDLIGVLFYGTKEKNEDYDNIFIKYRLGTPDVDRILELERYEKDPELLKKELGSSKSSYALHEVFWCSGNLFKSLKNQKIAPKKIIMITNNDNPHTENQSYRPPAKKRAQDLFDNDISLHILSWDAQRETPFDASLFYNDLLRLEEEEPYGSITSCHDSTEFKRTLSRKEMKKRSQFSVLFKLHGDFEIAVQGFNLVIDQKKIASSNAGFKSLYLNPRTNRLIEVSTKDICVDTGNVLNAEDILYRVNYGKHPVLFTKSEMNQIRNLFSPGIELLGFQPRSWLKPQYNIKHASFLYPDEKTISGSTSVFANLLASTKEMDKIAICRLTPRANANTRLVALLPEYESLLYPDGFHAIYLPFSDDIRSIPTGALPKVNDEMIQKAMNIVKKLTIKNFDPSNFPNPALQQHLMNLQAVALKRTDAERVSDFTYPHYDLIDQVAGQSIEDLLEMVNELYGDELELQKRKPEFMEMAKEAKKAKLNSSEFTELEMREAIQNGTIVSLTVPVLSAFLKSLNKKPPKKKADIIEMIVQSLSS